MGIYNHHRTNLPQKNGNKGTSFNSDKWGLGSGKIETLKNLSKQEENKHSYFHSSFPCEAYVLKVKISCSTKKRRQNTGYFVTKLSKKSWEIS